MLDLIPKIWYDTIMDKLPVKRILLIAAFAAYILVMVYITLLSRDATVATIELHPLASYRRAANAPRHLAIIEIRNAILNIAMFVPLGIFMPLLSAKFRKSCLALPIALLTSLAIEIAQLVTHRGVFSIEDIIHNTLGAALGLTLFLTAPKIFNMFCYNR